MSPAHDKKWYKELSEWDKTVNKFLAVLWKPKDRFQIAEEVNMTDRPVRTILKKMLEEGHIGFIETKNKKKLYYRKLDI